jgi:hypothetical protein
LRKPAFDVSRVQRFDPPMNRGTRAFIVVNFSIALVAATALLWYSAALPFWALAAAATLILGVLWMIGAVMQGRLPVATALAIEFAALLLLSAAVAAPSYLPRA